MPLSITSMSFRNEEPIPQRFTCDGVDLSPPLSWSGMPKGTRSFALICDDPDAPMGTWVHWVAFNIPATATGFMEGKVPEGTILGVNSWGKPGYGGPCPPGGTHRYFFRLFALDTRLDLPRETSTEGLTKAMDGHVLAQVELMGKYSRE